MDSKIIFSGVLVLLFVLLLGCDQSICGDKVCNSNESQYSCPQDCGYPPVDAQKAISNAIQTVGISGMATTQEFYFKGSESISSIDLVESTGLDASSIFFVSGQMESAVSVGGDPVGSTVKNRDASGLNSEKMQAVVVCEQTGEMLDKKLPTIFDNTYKFETKGVEYCITSQPCCAVVFQSVNPSVDPETEARTAWKSAEPWGILDWTQSNSSLKMVLKNNTSETLFLTGFQVTPNNIVSGEPLEIVSGATKIVEIQTEPCTSQKYLYPKQGIAIYYNSVNVLSKVMAGVADIVGTCSVEPVVELKLLGVDSSYAVECNSSTRTCGSSVLSNSVSFKNTGNVDIPNVEFNVDLLNSASTVNCSQYLLRFGAGDANSKVIPLIRAGEEVPITMDITAAYDDNSSYANCVIKWTYLNPLDQYNLIMDSKILQINKVISDPVTDARTAWKSAEPWGIVDWTFSGNNLTLVMKNNTTEQLKLNSIKVSSQKSDFNLVAVEPGAVFTANITNFSLCTGATEYNISPSDISISYSSNNIDGKIQSGVASILGTCPALDKILVIGEPSLGERVLLDNLSNVFTYRVILASSLSSNVSSADLAEYKIIILDQSNSTDKSVSVALGDAFQKYVAKGGKLIVVMNSGAYKYTAPTDLVVLNPYAIGWKANFGNIVPANCVVGEYNVLSCDNKSKLSVIGRVFAQDFNSPIMSGINVDPILGQAPRAMETFPVQVSEGAKTIAFLRVETAPKTYPAIIEKKAFPMGDVIYFNYDPGMTPEILKNTLYYLK